MNFSQALHALFVDAKLQAALVVVVLDVALGSLAAAKKHQFRLSYFGDFARNDILFKLMPWGAIYVGAKFAGGQDLLIPGIDLDVAATAFYVAIMAAWAGSLLGSVKDLGIEMPPIVSGPENEKPPGPPPPEM